jgi:hypothetical protein
MALNPFEQLFYTTIRIEAIFGSEVGTGTGFFFSFPTNKPNEQLPVIVTNKHVVEGAKTLALKFKLTKQDGAVDHSSNFEIRYDDPFIINHPLNDVDLCCLPIAHLITHSKADGERAIHRQLYARTDPPECRY